MEINVNSTNQEQAMRVLNAFSASMLPQGESMVKFLDVSRATARLLLEEGEPIESAVGHQDTAAVFSAELGVVVPVNRVNVSLEDGESVLLGQYSGPRLPEGATTLPEGASIRWMLVVKGRL